MPKYFGHKGHNKQTWQFKKTHPQLRVFQKETQARIGFFDQIEQLVQKQRSLTIAETLGRTPIHRTIHQHCHRQPQYRPGHKQQNRLSVVVIPKPFMAQFPTNPQSVPPTEEQVMTVKEYIKAVKSGRIPKGPNHAVIEELVTKPHAQQTKVIVLSYEHPKPKTPSDTKQHKST